MAKIDDAKKALANTKTTSLMSMIEASTGELGKALPSHFNAERLKRLATTTLRRNPRLMDVASGNPKSFLGALFQCAQLGLELDMKGEAFIIPYGKECVFQIGYPGWKELFYRHDANAYLEWGEAKENDVFEYQKGSNSYLKHIEARGDRGEATHYWVMAHLKDGGAPFHVMTVEDCLNHGKKHSKTFNKPDSPWKTNTQIMCLKTVLIQLMKLIPTSVEIQKAIAMDETIKNLDPARFKAVGGDMSEIKDETDWKEVEVEDVTEEEVEEKKSSLRKKVDKHKKETAQKQAEDFFGDDEEGTDAEVDEDGNFI